MKFHVYALLVSGLVLGASNVEAAINAQAEKKINELVTHFLDVKNHKGISWQCFAKDMAKTLDRDARQPKLANTMRQLAGVNDPVAIGTKMLAHKGELSPSTIKLIEAHGQMALLSIIKQRLAIKQTC